MKFLGKVWKFLILLLIILIVAAFLVPYIYEDEIKEEIKSVINEEINAKVDFDDVSISLFKSFPKLALDVNNITVHGIDEFEKTKLFGAKYIRLNADFNSVLKETEPIQIESIELDEADINIVVSKNGKANYDIIPSNGDMPETTNRDFVLVLEEYSLSKSNFTYKDYSSDVALSANGLNHSGTGNFTADKFDLNTITDARELSFSSSGTNYLSRVKLNGKNKVRIDNNTSTYNFDDNEIQLNSLTSNIDGNVKLGEDIAIDLKFDAPNSTFGQFLSVVPNGFKGDFNKVDAKGTAKVNGKVKGVFNSAKGKLPGYEVDIDVANGYAKFPESPNALEDVVMKMKLRSSNGKDIDLNVPSFAMKSGTSFMNGDIVYQTASNSPMVVSNLNANIDLQEMNSAFPVEGMENITGNVVINNLNIDTDLKAIENKNFDQIKFSGDVNMTDINLEMEDSPNITIDNFAFKADPKNIDIKKSNLRFGKSDMSLEGNVSNPLAYFVPGENISGKLKTKSKKIDLNEWMSNEKEGTSSPTVMNEELEALAKNASFEIESEADEILYGDFELKGNRLNGLVSGEQIDIKSYTSEVYDNPFELDGKLENLFDFVMKNEVMTGELTMNSSHFDINPFLAEDLADTNSSSKDKASEIFRVPENMNIIINTKLKDVTYQKLNFEAMNGTIGMVNGVINFNEVVSRALGGEMNFEGLYDSTVEQPLFSLKYDMSKLSFQKTFESLPIVDKLAGIMGFIDGIFNSTLVMEANLDENMFPNLSTLNAQGFIETLTGKIKGLEPLRKAGDQLGISDFESFDISNTKNWFEIKNGTVGLKPEEYHFKGIDLLVSGSHAYNTDMSYTILAKVPRSKFDENTISQAANTGMKFLEQKAGEIGINIDQGEFINLRIDLGGSILKPKIKITPIGAEGKSVQDQIKDEVVKKIEQTKDTIIDIANQKVEEVKDTVTKVVEAKVDTITDQVKDKVNEKIDTLQEQLKDKAMEKVDTVVGDILGETLDTFLNDKVDTLLQGKIDEILGDKKKEEVDKIKDKIKDWNPFKKKGN